MFTVCPKCALTLVVTAADLRVAQGYVRCGRCSSVFNALARLTEERAAAAPEPPPAPPPQEPAAGELEPEPPAGEDDAIHLTLAEEEPAADAPAAEPAGGEERIPEEALEFNPDTDVNSVFVESAPDPQWTAATGSFKSLVAANQEVPAPEAADAEVDVEIDAAFLAEMLSAEHAAPQPQAVPPAPPAAPPARVVEAPARVSPPQRPVPRAAAPHPRPAARAVVRPAPAPAAPPAPAPPAAPPEAAADAAAAGEPATADEAAASFAPFGVKAAARGADAAPPVGIWKRYGFAAGCVTLALLLAAQIVNHNRDELAASARWYRPLTALYGALGVRLFPHWDLHAYDVRQLGAAADSDGHGTITVRASIKNAAAQAQPLPLLRITLEDRFGNRIASRDVTPQAYLPPAVPPQAFLSSGQRIDAEMGFADPGAQAVGFEIDACLPARGGIACANDAALR